MNKPTDTDNDRMKRLRTRYPLLSDAGILARLAKPSLADIARRGNDRLRRRIAANENGAKAKRHSLSAKEREERERKAQEQIDPVLLRRRKNPAAFHRQEAA